MKIKRSKRKSVRTPVACGMVVFSPPVAKESPLPGDSGERRCANAERSVRRVLWLIFFVGCTAPPGREAFVLRIAMWGPLGELTSHGGNDRRSRRLAQPWVFERCSARWHGQLKPVLPRVWSGSPLSGSRGIAPGRHVQ